MVLFLPPRLLKLLDVELHGQLERFPDIKKILVYLQGIFKAWNFVVLRGKGNKKEKKESGKR
jgi:hypothetical protein